MIVRCAANMHNSHSAGRKDETLNQPVSKVPRTLIVWGWLPCNHLGAGILLRRLFADFPSDRLWALTSRQSVSTLASHDPVPPAERQIPVLEVQIHRRWFDKLAQLLNRMLIPCTVWRGVRFVGKQQIEAIFTVPWDHFTIAAYFIHAITGVPIFMYIMDDPAGTRRSDGSQPFLYRIFMPRLVRACKRVWGVSEGMCDYFEKTYGVKCLPLLPALAVENFQKTRVLKRSESREGAFRIVYTGAIYTAQLDAIQRLVRVIDQGSGRNDSRGLRFELTMYTSLSETALMRMGLFAQNAKRSEVGHADVGRVLAEASLAFLPLSFEPAMRHIVETSFPSKIAEYLASGVPMLVHAPPYSAVARYCKENACGLVVDEPSERALCDALLRLATDNTLRERLSARALETAKKNHDVTEIVGAFFDQIR